MIDLFLECKATYQISKVKDLINHLFKLFFIIFYDTFSMIQATLYIVKLISLLLEQLFNRKSVTRRHFSREGQVKPFSWRRTGEGTYQMYRDTNNSSIYTVLYFLNPLKTDCFLRSFVYSTATNIVRKKQRFSQNSEANTYEFLDKFSFLLVVPNRGLYGYCFQRFACILFLMT